MEWYSWVFAGIAAIFLAIDIYLGKQLTKAHDQLVDLQHEIKISEYKIQALQEKIHILNGNV